VERLQIAARLLRIIPHRADVDDAGHLHRNGYAGVRDGARDRSRMVRAGQVLRRMREILALVDVGRNDRDALLLGEEDRPLLRFQIARWTGSLQQLYRCDPRNRSCR
jgi:hypothetical protein